MEKEQVREKETELGKSQHYDQKIKRYREKIERSRKGLKVVRGKDIPWSQSRQAITKHYCDDDMTENALTSMRFFVHEIRTHSGKHIHPGGLVLFVLRGQGRTVVDKVNYEWSEGDLICLPIKKGGVEHQHFNKGGKPSRWLAIISLPFWDLIGYFMEQRENHPNWK